MLGDPSAVKEAEAMMNDPEFKSEINQYMETLKNNSAFRDAMAEAQRKYQVGGGLHFAFVLGYCTTRGVWGDFGQPIYPPETTVHWIRTSDTGDINVPFGIFFVSAPRFFYVVSGGHMGHEKRGVGSQATKGSPAVSARSGRSRVLMVSRR